MSLRGKGEVVWGVSRVEGRARWVSGKELSAFREMKEGCCELCTKRLEVGMERDARYSTIETGLQECGGGTWWEVLVAARVCRTFRPS